MNSNSNNKRARNVDGIGEKHIHLTRPQMTRNELIAIELQIKSKEIEKDVEYTNKPKIIARDGVWQVPPAERPKSWRCLDVREPTIPFPEQASPPQKEQKSIPELC